MSVYFVHCPTTNAVKIGYAEDAFKRFSKIQSDSPGELALLAIEDGGRDREAQLHAQFASFRRKRGEWFDYGQALRSYVEALPTPEKPRKRYEKHGALGRWLYDNNITMREFGGLVGASAATICQFCNEQNIPRHDLMVRIYVATHGEVQPNHFYALPRDS